MAYHVGTASNRVAARTLSSHVHKPRISMVDSLNASTTSAMAEDGGPPNVDAVAVDSPPPDETNAAKPSPVDEPSTESCEPQRWLGLHPRDQVFVGVLALVMLAASAIHAFKASRWSLMPVELSHHPERLWEFRLDINTANWVEWMQLDGIGERLALRIVEDREANGPFQSIDDLDRVNGIGPKTIEKLRPHLKCE